MPIIYPSLIDVDQSHLPEVIKMLDPHVIGYHLDVMDNKFVPNFTWDASTVNHIAQLTSRIAWVHLMVINPPEWINRLKLHPESIVSFHYEAASTSAESIIAAIKQRGWLASIAINPDTAIRDIEHLLSHVDQVLIMSVQPGFSGQQFITNALHKLEVLVEYRMTHTLHFRIGMDGGINTDNIGTLVRTGVDDIAAASSIFGQGNPVEALEVLKKLCAAK